jgi:hypothetical protein
MIVISVLYVFFCWHIILLMIDFEYVYFFSNKCRIKQHTPIISIVPIIHLS